MTTASTLNAPNPFVHGMALYGSDQEFIRAFVPFCREGQELDEPIVVRVEPRDSDLLRGALGETAGIDFIDHGDQCQDPPSALAAALEIVDHSARGGTRRMRLEGELPPMVGLFRDAWVRYEAAATHALRDHPVLAVCPFDRRTVPASLEAELPVLLRAWARRDASSSPSATPVAVPLTRSPACSRTAQAGVRGARAVDHPSAVHRGRAVQGGRTGSPSAWRSAGRGRPRAAADRRGGRAVVRYGGGMVGIVARGVEVSFGGQPVLPGVDVTLGDSMRLGLTGPNGAGKSTLLRVLAGELLPDAGTVKAVGTVGHLPQEADRRQGETLLAYLARRTGTGPADRELQAAAAALDGGGEAEAQRYDLALQRWLDLGGADLDARASEVVADLGLGEEVLALETMALSGGQMARGQLAAILLSRFDVLLLDEPTNDLDLDGLDRLERFVGAHRGALVLVSHDREFLARTVTDVLELDPANASAKLFAGGYDAYLAEREVHRRHRREAHEAAAEQRDALVTRVQNAREQSVRGAFRAKHRAPDNDRAARGAKLEAATKGAQRVRSLETRLRHLDEQGIPEPRKEWDLRLALPVAGRSGEVVASLRGAVVRRGGFTLGPVDLDLRWADRVAVTGPNGGGKTTLLQALLGRLPLDAGTATLGRGVVVGELDQVRRAFAGDETVVRVVADAADLEPVEVRTLLAKFGLGAVHVARPARSLSPGERTRAGLALLMARDTNCLVLDEPTNHLDLPAIEQLEDALATYAGTLLLVSHDRRLLDAVPVTRTLHVVDGAVTER